MSDRLRNHLTIVGLVVMALTLFLQQWWAHDRTSRLDRHGVIAPGMTRDVRSDKFESFALVEFTSREGQTRTLEVPVSRAFAVALIRQGRERPVNVRYLPHDDRIADIAGASETSGLTVALALGLLGVAGWVFWSTRRKTG